jgi:hypothetical protein
MAEKEYIERGNIEKWLLTEMSSLDGEEDRKYVVERLRNEIPAADVVPVVRGKWEYNPSDNIPYCSECMMPQDSECNFCPNCGARMEES